MGDDTMSVALGKKILGALIAVGGISALISSTLDVITGVLIFCGGAALFFWGLQDTGVDAAPTHS
jgi:hypothetical protein